MTKAEIIQRVIERLPYSQQIKKIDIESEEKAIRFEWRGDIFRVSDSLFVENIVGSFAKGDNKAILLEALLKGRGK